MVELRLTDVLAFEDGILWNPSTALNGSCTGRRWYTTATPRADYLTSYHDVDNLFTGDTLGLTPMVVILLSAASSISSRASR